MYHFLFRCGGWSFVPRHKMYQLVQIYVDILVFFAYHITQRWFEYESSL